MDRTYGIHIEGCDNSFFVNKEASILISRIALEASLIQKKLNQEYADIYKDGCKMEKSIILKTRNCFEKHREKYYAKERKKEGLE